MKNLTTLDIVEVQNGLKNKDFTSVQVTKAVIDEIKRQDKNIQAYLKVTEEVALVAAEAYDQNPKQFSSSLAGVPLAIKDTIITKGIKTTAGSKILENYIPPYDATVISRLQQAGAIIVGKTNCDEFAMGVSGELSAFGPTKNPRDNKKVPGGSSSGSAAAVAANMCIAALGTDTGGSVRQPASFCGVVGLRPTYGLVSRYGLIAMASSLDTVGTLTKTAQDAALLLEAIAGPDERDATAHQAKAVKAQTLTSKKIADLTVGIPRQYFPDTLDPKIRQAVEQSVEKLKQNGVAVKAVDLPLTEMALAAYYIIVPAEVSSNLARYDGLRFGTSATHQELTQFYAETRGQNFGDEVKRRIMMGTFSLSAGYSDKYYTQAAKVRRLIANEFNKVFQQVNALITPTAPSVAFSFAEHDNDPLAMYLSDMFTTPASLAGIPAISIPAGTVDDLPVGTQLMSGWHDEATILSLAKALEG